MIKLYENEKKFILAALAIWYRGGAQGNVEVLLQKRIEDGPLSGSLEFPGGKIQEGESADEAAMRESREEIGQEVTHEIKLFKIYNFEYLDRRVQLHACLGEAQGPVALGDCLQWYGLQAAFPPSLLAGSHLIWSDVAKFFNDKLT